ncbi:hypothetical protein NQT69_10160 [Pseudoalteromonas shioyasakiensis]|uniref:hypothetical protein n=1 Tax=Pseudoalteromonas shioyasakiensis TaxID=1190813 RepID=UPI002118EEDF|nr:hypothetical protein [Pseudoalteromonas shioyasakiensis]MCQ8878361.1 hypothetical protein [Pseudoalteromonas shioyasakiensis]
MDIMIPYLGQITRLQIESKGAFHIAGLKDSNAQRIEREKRQKRELAQQTKMAEKAVQERKKQQENNNEDDNHLDTWA